MTTPAGPAASDDEAAGAGVPVCYRHADRETYVRCSRCERSICPDCMRDAAVGFQCPECVAEGSRSVRQPRTTFGGRVSGDVGKVTTVLIAINVVMFVLQSVAPVVETRLFMLPAFPGGPGFEGVAGGEYYRLLTAAFLHGGALHLLFNMLALFAVGPQLEQLLGRARFLALYLLSALGGSVLFYVLADPAARSVGASGAVFGLFGALVVVSKRLKYDVQPIVTIIGFNLLITFLFANFIDWRGHVGGLVTGTLLAAAFAFAPPALRRLVSIAVPAAMALLFAALVVARTAALS